MSLRQHLQQSLQHVVAASGDLLLVRLVGLFIELGRHLRLLLLAARSMAPPRRLGEGETAGAA
jgi:hypothetical protein